MLPFPASAPVLCAKTTRRKTDLEEYEPTATFEHPVERPWGVLWVRDGAQREDTEHRVDGAFLEVALFEIFNSVREDLGMWEPGGRGGLHEGEVHLRVRLEEVETRDLGRVCEAVRAEITMKFHEEDEPRYLRFAPRPLLDGTRVSERQRPTPEARTHLPMSSTTPLAEAIRGAFCFANRLSTALRIPQPRSCAWGCDSRTSDPTTNALCQSRISTIDTGGRSLSDKPGEEGAAGGGLAEQDGWVQQRVHREEREADRAEEDDVDPGAHTVPRELELGVHAGEGDGGRRKRVRRARTYDLGQVMALAPLLQTFLRT